MNVASFLSACIVGRLQHHERSLWLDRQIGRFVGQLVGWLSFFYVFAGCFLFGMFCAVFYWSACRSVLQALVVPYVLPRRRWQSFKFFRNDCIFRLFYGGIVGALRCVLVQVNALRFASRQQFAWLLVACLV